MRRMLLPFLVAVFLTSGVAAAGGSWQRFSSRSFGFAVRYPSDWHGTVANVPGVKELVLQRQGKTPYAMTVLVLDLKPGATPRQTVQRVAAQEQASGGQGLGSIHWSPAPVGGKAALAGVMRPPTEGGVTVANAIYVVGWRSHTYEITLTAYVHPAPTRVAQFPAVYRQILASWRFMS